MNIVVTGFGSFLDNDNNPTKELLSILPRNMKGNRIILKELPVVFDECFNELKPVIDIEKPEVIILLGLAGGRKGITPERIAINMKDGLQDNRGNQFDEEPISPKGKTAYFSSLPLKRIVTKLKEKKIPVSISNTAGLYVCNNIMYRILEYIDQNKLDTIAGFVHVPFMEGQVDNKDTFTMPIDVMVEGIIDIIKESMFYKKEGKIWK